MLSMFTFYWQFGRKQYRHLNKYCSSTTYCISPVCSSQLLGPSSGYYEPPNLSGGCYMVFHPGSATIADCIGGVPIGRAGYLRTAREAVRQTPGNVPPRTTLDTSCLWGSE